MKKVVSFKPLLIRVLLLVCVSPLITVFSQKSLQDIDMYLIPQKKVKQFITNQIQNNILHFTDVMPSCDKDDDISGYWKHEKSYKIKENIDDVWENYLTADPSDVWEGHIVSFGMLFSKITNEVVYRNEEYNHIDTGQVYYVNLKFWHGVYNLAVAFEVINVDEEHKVLEFSYVKSGISHGKQRIHFVADEKGNTRIYHDTYFRSHSNLRDRILYPHFHKKVINEYHRNMRHQIYG